MRLLTVAQICHDATSDRVRTCERVRRKHPKWLQTSTFKELLAKSLVNTQGFTFPNGMHPAITIRPGCSLPAGTDLVSAVEPLRSRS